MKPLDFINNFRTAFGNKPQLPIVFWYSEHPAGNLEKINGCFFKGFERAKNGEILTLSSETITCGGGKLYIGFIENVPERIPNFVSKQEKYKQAPEQVTENIDRLELKPAPHPYINFAPIDKINSFDGKEGILFLQLPMYCQGLLHGLSMTTTMIAQYRQYSDQDAALLYHKQLRKTGVMEDVHSLGASTHPYDHG